MVRGLDGEAPSLITEVDTFLRQVMPDYSQIRNASSGSLPRANAPAASRAQRRLEISWRSESQRLTLPLEAASDGERCFLAFALALAARQDSTPFKCFWDEPENYLAPDEVASAVTALRRAFQYGGQLVLASHNAEVVRGFADENTLVLQRKSHLEPTTARRMSDLRTELPVNDVAQALVRGDLG